ncbi:polysaccharide lyase [Paraglaciecola sp.]|uniref:polysaccharide lyase n=1 Tax=Paraglaciecola sp. TaxID=1920173 RepID=UPI00326300B2
MFSRDALAVDKNFLLSEHFESEALPLRCSGNCPTITEDLAFSGAKSLKIQLDLDSSPVSYRTEVQQAGFANFKDVYRYAFKIYLPDSYVADSVWELVAQWHAYPDFEIGETWRNPPLALATTNGEWTISNAWDAKRNTFATGNRVYDGQEKWVLGDYETDVWTAWLFEVKWSHTDDGYIKVWKNGELVVSKSGPNTFNDKVGTYFKAGIYKGWRNKNTIPKNGVRSRTLYFDDITIETKNGGVDPLK